MLLIYIFFSRKTGEILCSVAELKISVYIQLCAEGLWKKKKKEDSGTKRGFPPS